MEVRRVEWRWVRGERMASFTWEWRRKNLGRLRRVTSKNSSGSLSSCWTVSMDEEMWEEKEEAETPSLSTAEEGRGFKCRAPYLVRRSMFC